MTLTELRYVIALAKEGSFSRAAQRCAVSQPSLSIAIARLEDELGVLLFERAKTFTGLSDIGRKIVEQAERTLAAAETIRHIAMQGKNELHGAFRLGVIHTIAPYLLPELVLSLHEFAPQMPLMVEENMTAHLTAMLDDNALDAVILALPFEAPGVVVRPLYDEHFQLIVPEDHPLASVSHVHQDDLPVDEMLLLKAGNCFRDQVLEACPKLSRPEAHGRLGHSIETIRCMVASGLGVSVFPESALTGRHENRRTKSIPFIAPQPSRRVALIWRVGFIRPKAIDALIHAVSHIDNSAYRKLP